MIMHMEVVRDASECIALCLLRTRGCAATLLHRHWTCVETHILLITWVASPGPPLHLDRCCCSREEPHLLGLAQLYLHSKITFVTFIHAFIHTFLYNWYSSNVNGPNFFGPTTTSKCSTFSIVWLMSKIITKTFKFALQPRQLKFGPEQIRIR